MVPSRPRYTICPKFSKNLFFFNENPAAKMIGGKIPAKKS
jgi:hypothetical protein